MKTCNMYETITGEYWKFLKQPKSVKFPPPSFFFPSESFISLPVRTLLDAVWGDRAGGLGGGVDVNEDTDAEI